MRIEKLQRRFSETHIDKDEVLPKETISRINKNYNKNQRRRRVDLVLNNVKNKDSIKKEVHQIVDELPNLEILCKNCKEELIISVIILYVQKTRNPRYHVDRTALWSKYELDWKKYSLIVSRLFQESRKTRILQYKYDV